MAIRIEAPTTKGCQAVLTKIPTEKPEVFYPESDGKPMADNTRQFQWIVTIEGGLDALFRNDPNVFVAGDLLWYPVEGDNRTRSAPDAMVVFGRPKGHRGSYLQWLEGNIAPQVVFEVLSPGNRRGAMVRKRNWYAHYGVEEYYEYDPDRGTLVGWLRNDKAKLVPIPNMLGWTSPRLGVQFGMEGDDLVMIGPDGRRFESYVDVVQRQELAEVRAELAETQTVAERLRAEGERLRAVEAETRAEEERQRTLETQAQVEQERLRAVEAEKQMQQEQIRFERERLRASEAEKRAQRLVARLRELGLSEE